MLLTSFPSKLNLNFISEEFYLCLVQLSYNLHISFIILPRFQLPFIQALTCFEVQPSSQLSEPFPLITSEVTFILPFPSPINLNGKLSIRTLFVSYFNYRFTSFNNYRLA
ncbi:MAG: hypothetical protein ACTS5F_01880 [Candidatus Hodgkinia cicadicola]